ncbi:spore coat protein CotH [Flammeovirgaceae bacterium 311]|nr:spore coat protein CotH [Flammeovirgaceae bacterium 311]
MKKLLLLLILIATAGHVSAQQVFSQHRVFLTTGDAILGNDVWHQSKSWVVAKDKYSGDPGEIDVTQYDDPELVQAATNFPGELKNRSIETTGNEGTGVGERLIVVVRRNHTLYLREHVLLSGNIILEPGAKLVFNKENGDKGRLEMIDMGATIFMRGMPASDIYSNSTYDSGNAADFLMIGQQSVNLEKINGLWINALPSPMADSKLGVIEVPIDAAFLKCLTNGTWSKDEVWTVEKLITILKCANPYLPLPVELLSLNVSTREAEVQLDWAVANEKDFSHYEVEWSADAQNFYYAGTVAGKGTEKGTPRYNFLHQPGQTGTLYYRLLAVDIDGAVEDKGMRVVRLGGEVFNVYASQGRLHINYNGPSNSNLAIMDTSGRLVSNSSLAAEGIETAGLRPGIYIVQISNVLERKTQRVLIY